MIVSLVALFTACSSCSRTLIYDKCSTALQVLSCIEGGVKSSQYIRLLAMNLWQRFDRSQRPNCSPLLWSSSVIRTLVPHSHSHRSAQCARWSSSALLEKGEQPRFYTSRCRPVIGWRLGAVPPSEWKGNPELKIEVTLRKGDFKGTERKGKLIKRWGWIWGGLEGWILGVKPAFLATL